MRTFLNQLFLIVTFGGITQGLFVVLILNSRSVRRTRATLFLSILLIALSFNVAHTLYAGAVINHFSAQVYSVGDPTFYLIAPLLWFYTSELTGNRVRRSWRLLLHFLPFFLIVLFSLFIQSTNDEALLAFLNNYHRVATILFWISVVVQFSWYLILARNQWLTYATFVQGEVSNPEGVDISWVRFFMAVFLIINLFFLFSLFAAIHLEGGPWLPKMSAVVFSLSVFALGYKGILQRELLYKETDRIPDQVILNPAASPVVPATDQALLARLLAYMGEVKPFLDPELTLTALAKALHMSRSQLSLLINEGTGDNFYDFINKYRVEEVKRLMGDPQVKNYSLLGIALEAGFKSKSTFNLIFKRFTGLTPGEYRKNQT